ncbi:type II toxin-antitoxin system RelE/ParE family toxin [Ottowia sp.]|uniref:type II toxin-antitoxin system RelE/ParE family toxin n=1 Tax=Ottowia sp. TaxID=1898956 RepID=UPI0039E5533D
MTKVIFLRSAEADLGDLRAYVVRRFGMPVWRKSLGKIKDTVALIERHPQSGSVPPELEGLALGQFRQLIAGMNRVIYELRDGAAFIHLVCDTRRDLQLLLLRRLTRGE